MFDYFYGQSGEMFSYFRVPKILFRDIKFKDLSTDAKTLYGILLDRMGLSVKNGWLDEQGRVYIIFPVQEVMNALGCADNKATKLFRELENAGLVERKRRGLGKPNLIYVKNFADPRFRNREKNGSVPRIQRSRRRQNHEEIRLSGIKPRGVNLILSPPMRRTNRMSAHGWKRILCSRWRWTCCSGPARMRRIPSISMGWQQPDELPVTLSTLMAKAMNDQSIPPGEGILHHAEGVDLIPANIELAGLEVSLVNSMNREKMLKQVLDSAKHDYDFILLNCTPSLGMLTVVAPLLWLAVRTMCEFIIISCGDTAINALAAADTTLIPVQAQYLSAKGLEQLLQTIQKVRRQINPKLKIEGILMTMTDSRTNYGSEIDALIRQVYGSKIRVFEQPVPHSVRAAEISAGAGASLPMTRKERWQRPINL